MKLDFMCDIAFSVVVDKKDIDMNKFIGNGEIASDIGCDAVLAALQKRVDYLKANPDELDEAIDVCDWNEVKEEDDEKNPTVPA